MRGLTSPAGQPFLTRSLPGLKVPALAVACARSWCLQASRSPRPASESLRREGKACACGGSFTPRGHLVPGWRASPPGGLLPRQHASSTSPPCELLVLLRPHL